MPIASGAKGRMSILASPKGGWTPRGDGTGGPRGTTNSAPLGGWSPRSRFRSPVLFRSPGLVRQGKFLTGVTRDSVGAPLPGVTVRIFDSADDRFIERTTSDGSGVYRFGVGQSSGYYLVEYLSGSPDVFGTSRRDLVGE